MSGSPAQVARHLHDLPFAESSARVNELIRAAHDLGERAGWHPIGGKSALWEQFKAGLQFNAELFTELRRLSELQRQASGFPGPWTSRTVAG